MGEGKHTLGDRPLNNLPVDSSFLNNQMWEHSSLQSSFRFIHKPSPLKALSKANQSVWDWGCPSSPLVLQLLLHSSLAAPFRRQAE